VGSLKPNRRGRRRNSVCRGRKNHPTAARVSAPKPMRRRHARNHTRSISRSTQKHPVGRGRGHAGERPNAESDCRTFLSWAVAGSHGVASNRPIDDHGAYDPAAPRTGAAILASNGGAARLASIKGEEKRGTPVSAGQCGTGGGWAGLGAKCRPHVWQLAGFAIGTQRRGPDSGMARAACGANSAPFRFATGY